MSFADFGKSLKKGLATAMGVPEIKQKVLTATSNDAWGPTGQQMREIADATHHYAEFGLIMESIWERLNEPGKYWRHVYKALLLLDYLLKNGADQCVREARVKMIEIKTLTEFQHIDDKDKDQGLSVRERAKAIVELLHDERRLNEERSKARANRDKYTNAISSDQARYGGGGGSYGGSGGGSGGGRSYQSKRPTGPPSYVDEQDYEPPSRTAPTYSSGGGGGNRSFSKNNDLDFSSGDDMDDEFPDYQSPAPAARQPEPARVAPAPAPAPLFDLLGGEPARPAPVADPNAGFFGATPATAPAGFGFPGAAPAPQFGGFQTQTPAAVGGFPGGFPSASPSPAAVGGFPGGFPTSSPAPVSAGGFPTGPGPAVGGFTMPTAAHPAPVAATPAPAFFQPTPEADFGDFQSGPAAEAARQPEPARDPSDPWARNDLFSFSKDKPASATASAVKKTPMGAAGTKPAMGGMAAPTVPGNANMFGMTQPTMMPGYPATMGAPGFVGQPQPGFGMVAAPAPGGFGMVAPAPGGFGMAAAPGGFGMAAPAGYGMTPGMMPMAGGMGVMGAGAYPGYGQR